MCSMRNILKVLIILIATNFISSKSLPTIKGDDTPNENSNISWLQQMRKLRHRIKECENSSNITIWNCWKITTLNIFDEISSRQKIPIWRGVSFVHLPDIHEKNSTKNFNELWVRKDLQHLTWFDRFALSVNKMLNTHMLEINFKDLTDAFMENIKENELLSSTNNTDPVGTARLRRHRHNMMMTMMFGVTAFGAVLVPMGFQMLSIVSGKALLLAKMALLLASINGLKRVANSGIHYGLYHVPGEHYGNLYDRGDIHHPRNVQHVIPQPMDVELNI